MPDSRNNEPGTCRRCHRPIPLTAERCPYCGALTRYGMEAIANRAVKAVSPANILRKIRKIR